MIDYIVQVENQNMLQVVYKSGYNRFIFPDQWGLYESNMTKTQLEFMKNSFKVEMVKADSFDRTFYYWLNKNNPNKGVLSAIRVKNELYRGVLK